MTDGTTTAATTVDGRGGVPWDGRFERIIRDNVPHLTDEELLRPDTRLADFGLGSLEILGLMVAIEAEYTITIPERLLTFETFATPGALWTTVVELYPGQPESTAEPAESPVPGGIPPGYQLPVDTGQRTVISFALAQLGKPYVYGAIGPTSYDCSALMMQAWAEVGVMLPRTVADQVHAGTDVSSVDTMAPGDLIFMPGSDGTMACPRHVGMYIGLDGTGRQWLVQAPHTGEVVKTIPVANVAQQIAAIRRPRTP